jgi:hypothetical protein
VARGHEGLQIPARDGLITETVIAGKEEPMPQPIPETPTDDDKARVIERPDGFYWQDRETEAVYGPFPSRIEAVRDMEFSDDEGDISPDQSLEEVEAELGISDWIEPETGEPAEDTYTRIEDH